MVNPSDVQYLVIDKEDYEWQFCKTREEALREAEEIKDYLLYDDGVAVDYPKPILIYKLFQLYDRGRLVYKDNSVKLSSESWNDFFRHNSRELDIVCVNYDCNDLSDMEDFGKYIVYDLFKIPIGFYVLDSFYQWVYDLELVEL